MCCPTDFICPVHSLGLRLLASPHYKILCIIIKPRFLQSCTLQLALVFQIPDFLTIYCFITIEAPCVQNTWKAPPSWLKKKSALQCYSLVGVSNSSASKDKIKAFICENPKTKMFHRITILFAMYPDRSLPTIQRKPQEMYLLVWLSHLRQITLTAQKLDSHTFSCQETNQQHQYGASQVNNAYFPMRIKYLNYMSTLIYG